MQTIKQKTKKPLNVDLQKELNIDFQKQAMLPPVQDGTMVEALIF